MMEASDPANIHGGGVQGSGTYENQVSTRGGGANGKGKGNGKDENKGEGKAKPAVAGNGLAVAGGMMESNRRRGVAAEMICDEKGANSLRLWVN